jgi:Cu(I)/Ag(I) efflux system membrane fusion protein
MSNNAKWATSLVLALLIGGGIGYWTSMRTMPVTAPAATPAGTTAMGAPASKADAPDGRKVLYWHDPMVPGQKFDKPGKSPFMDMQLVPVYAEDNTTGGVAVSPAMTSSLGIRTTPVRKSAMKASIDAVGVVAENERASAVVQARTAGYIERLYARANFDFVAAGAPVALIYAPEWAGAQAEYLALRRAKTDPALVEAARQRLRLLSIPDSVVESAERNDAPETRYTLTSPRGGVVYDLAVRDGSMVTPGMTLLRVVSLGDVWVYAELPEAVAAGVAIGAQAEVRLPAYPEQVLRGRVSALLPQVNPTSRTLRARIELPNRDGQLKPGMQVNVALMSPRAQDALVVPQEAVIATGKRNVVIVREADGRFRPVEVVLGRNVGSDVEVQQGLREGESVVASGQFLLDSEASLKATLTRLDSGTGAMSAAAATGYHGTAKVEAIAGDEVMLSHGPIPALQWPPMTMGFKPPAGGLPKGLKVGDAIEFDFIKTPQGDYALTRIAPAAPGGAKP